MRGSRLEIVERVIQIRAVRRKHLPVSLFGGEQGWDILLELYRANLSSQQVTKESVIAAVDGPPSMLTRWIAALQDAGLVTYPRSVAACELGLAPRGLRALDSFIDDLLHEDSPIDPEWQI